MAHFVIQRQVMRFLEASKAPSRALIYAKVPGWDGRSITQSAPIESLFQ